MAAAGFGKRGIAITAPRSALVEKHAAPTDEKKSGMRLVAKVALYTVLAVVLTFVGLIAIVLSESRLVITNSDSPSTSTAIPTRDGWTVVSTDKIAIQRPSEPQATYAIIGIAKTADGKVVAMNTRYSQQSGWDYTMRGYDCDRGKLFTFGSGTTFEAMQVYRPDSQWGQLIQGSSATQVAAIACRVIGKSLSGVQ